MTLKEPAERAPAEPAGHAPRRGALLLRPPRRERQRPLARDARAGLALWGWWLVERAARRPAPDRRDGDRDTPRGRDVRDDLHAEGRREECGRIGGDQGGDVAVRRPRRRHRRGGRDPLGRPELPSRVRDGRGAN